MIGVEFKENRVYAEGQVKLQGCLQSEIRNIKFENNEMVYLISSGLAMLATFNVTMSDI